MQFLAYKIDDAYPLELVPASKKREWTRDVKGVGLCLPVQIANQWGWWVLNPVGFTAVRSEGDEQSSIEIYFDEPVEDSSFVASHFGYGVLTFFLPYLFRTDKGWNMRIGGPTNSFKGNIRALEGIVETDWTYSVATMNWLFEQENVEVRFEKGDPICHVYPIPRFIPELDVQDMPTDVKQMYEQHRDERRETLNIIAATGKPLYKRKYREEAYQK
jgi:hypothetical protein